MKYFSMFTGVGGFELGIGDKAECIGFCEIDKYCDVLLSRSFKGIINYKDCTLLKPELLPEFDLLCGGFPCQSFSIAGKRRGFEDTRGTMFFEVARVLQVKRPKLVLLENVKGLLNHNKGETFKVIIQTLEELGYDVQWMVLNSKFFGVPQNRERVFIIGNLRGTTRSEILPFRETSRDDVIQGEAEPEGRSWVSTIDSRYGQRWSSETYIKYERRDKSQHSRIYNSEGISPTLPGASKLSGDCTPKILAQPLKFLERNQKNLQGEYSFTVDSANTGGVREGSNIRRLTPIECERLQGFPDNWTEKGAFINKVQLIGNIWRHVKLRDAKEELLVEGYNSVLNIIKDGENGETQISLTQSKELILEGAKKDVVGRVSVEDGVCDIINLGKDMIIHYNQNKISSTEVLTKKALILELMEKQVIYPYLKITLEENLSKEKLSTILTSIKEIIKSQTFIYAKTEKPITTAIIVFRKLEQNFSNEELLDLRMENIIYFSDTQRYKMMGNAVTVNVVKAIAEKLLIYK